MYQAQAFELKDRSGRVCYSAIVSGDRVIMTGAGARLLSAAHVAPNPQEPPVARLMRLAASQGLSLFVVPGKEEPMKKPLWTNKETEIVALLLEQRETQWMARSVELHTWETEDGQPGPSYDCVEKFAAEIRAAYEPSVKLVLENHADVAWLDIAKEWMENAPVKPYRE